MKLYALFICIVLCTNASADVCPAVGEVIATTPYEWTKTCDATTIVVKGERNPEKYEACLGNTISAKELVFYRTPEGTFFSLPTVNRPTRQNAKDHAFTKSQLWLVAGDTSIHCEGKSSVSIVYWSGGNCKICEPAIKYTFDNKGRLKVAKFD